jgi:ABC-type branched-subunit amino acid transport system ATPase component
LAAHRIAGIGVAHCMEGRRIFPTLSVEENLRIAARGADAPSTRERLTSVYDLFPVLAERKNSAGTSMSGGQQQMLAIGRTLMARPRLVIFDEISLGLAPVVMDNLYEALALLKQARMTLIVIEQDVDRALALADHAYVLEHGVFGLSGSPQKIGSDPKLRHIYVGTAD